MEHQIVGAALYPWIRLWVLSIWMSEIFCGFPGRSFPVKLFMGFSMAFSPLPCLPHGIQSSEA